MKLDLNNKQQEQLTLMLQGIAEDITHTEIKQTEIGVNYRQVATYKDGNVHVVLIIETPRGAQHVSVTLTPTVFNS